MCSPRERLGAAYCHFIGFIHVDENLCRRNSMRAKLDGVANQEWMNAHFRDVEAFRYKIEHPSRDRFCLMSEMVQGRFLSAVARRPVRFPEEGSTRGGTGRRVGVDGNVASTSSCQATAVAVLATARGAATPVHDVLYVHGEDRAIVHTILGLGSNDADLCQDTTRYHLTGGQMIVEMWVGAEMERFARLQSEMTRARFLTLEHGRNYKEQ